MFKKEYNADCGIALGFIVTSLILLLTIFMLGFVADPIIKVYITGYTAFYRDSGLNSVARSDKAPILIPVEPDTYLEHMVKGVTSLGMLGFVKVIFMFGPQGVLNMRGTVRQGPARPGSGNARDRLGNLAWLMVLIGVLNFYLWVWKFVGRHTRAWLDLVADEILDVPDEEVRAN